MIAINDRQILLVTGHSPFSSQHSRRKGGHVSHLKNGQLLQLKDFPTLYAVIVVADKSEQQTVLVQFELAAESNVI